MTYIEPLLLLFSGIAVYGLWRASRGKSLRVAAAGVAGLVLVAWPPLDWLLSRHLEAWYPVRPFQTTASPQAIVLLTATITPPLYERPYPELGGLAYERAEMAIWLHRELRLPVLACGGGTDPRSQPDAITLREHLKEAGVPESMIWTEERSRSTYQHALYGAPILRQHGVRQIVLVVEAQSMLRAEACFRKQGISVLPAPSSFRQFGQLKDELLPGWKAIRRNEGTLHETLGLLWYRLRGWI